MFLHEPTRVVAFKWETATAIKFENPFSNIVQEVTIVGNGYNSAWVFFEEAFKPIHALGVKVVSRFVKQQKIRSAEKQAT